MAAYNFTELSKYDGGFASAHYYSTVHKGYIITARFGGGMAMFKIEGGQLVLKNEYTGREIYNVSSDEEYVYAASWTDGVMVFSINEGTGAATLEAERDTEAGVFFHAISYMVGSTKYIIAANENGGLRAYQKVGSSINLIDTDTDMNTAVWIFTKGAGEVIHVGWSAGAGGINAYTFNGSAFSLVKKWDGWATTNVCQAINGDDNYIYYANNTGGFYILSWDGANYTIEKSYDPGRTMYVTARGSLVYAANQADGFEIYSYLPPDLSVLITESTASGNYGSILPLDDFYVIVSTSDRYLRLFGFEEIPPPEITTYEGDARLVFEKGDAFGDVNIVDRDLERDPTFETAVIISLFTNKRAENEDVLPDTSADKCGWWGDTLYDNDSDGSRLWLLRRSKGEDAPLAQAEQYCSEALAWMKDDGIASAINVTASEEDFQTLLLEIEVERPDKDPLTFKYFYNWERQLSRRAD